MKVTVLPHRYVEAGGAAYAVPLAEALEYEWPTDAHCTQYEPLEVGGNQAVRAAKEAIDRLPLRMVALIGDVDGPGHEAPQEWRERAEAVLRESPFAWYATRNGYRVISELAEPFVVDSEARWNEWRGRYAAFVEECGRDYWVSLDPTADDPTRIFRLPNVERENVGKVRSPVRGRPPAWTLPAPIAPRGGALHERAKPSQDPALVAAALAARLPPSVEYHGGDQALHHAATELATVLRGDPDAVYSALSGVYNPRCAPPWPETKLRREAERAAARYRSDIGQRFLDWREDNATARGKTLDYWGSIVDRSQPPKPLPYVIETLGLAPGKCSAIQGAAGDGKTPFALLLSLCIATGEPFLGHAINRRGPVLYLAYEGGPLVEERDARLCAGLGIERTDAPVEIIHAAQPFDEGAIAMLREHIDRYQPTAVVVDTYSAALPSGVDANLSVYADALRALGRVSDATGALIVVLLHHRKNGGGLEAITGHSTIAGALQASIALHRERPEEDPTTVTVTCRRAPRNGFAPFRVAWADRVDPHAPTGAALVGERKEVESEATPAPKDTEADRKRYTARRRMLAELRKNSETRNTLVLRVGQGAVAGNDALSELEEQGLVKDTHGHYSLTDKGAAELVRFNG